MKTLDDLIKMELSLLIRSIDPHAFPYSYDYDSYRKAERNANIETASIYGRIINSEIDDADKISKLELIYNKTEAEYTALCNNPKIHDVGPEAGRSLGLMSRIVGIGVIINKYNNKED